MRLGGYYIIIEKSVEVNGKSVFERKRIFMEKIIFSSNIQNRQCYWFLNFHNRRRFWFCPARYGLIDRTEYRGLPPEERAECIPVKQVERLTIQRAYFCENAELREEWEARTRECPDEKAEESESWDIIEENLLNGAYEDFERAYLLRYAEDWCRENGIACEETDDYVPVPKCEESFEYIVDSVADYLAGGWTAEAYRAMIQDMNPEAEDLSAIDEVIEAAQKLLEEERAMEE